MRTFPVLAALLAALGCSQRTVHVARTPTSPTAVATTMRRQILNAADAGDGDRVVNQLRARMAADPSNASLRLELAAHYRKIGLPELEMEHLRLAMERFPESGPVRLALADALRAAGEPHQAAQILADFALAGFAPADAAMLNRLGICYDEAGDWKAGEEAFRRALTLDPGRDHLYNNLGYNLLEQQRLSEAAAAFQQALRVNPNSVVARNNLGVTLVRLSVKDGGMVAEALRHFENVADAATAHNNLAAALIEQNRYDESRRLLQAALDYNRSHASALANLKLVAELDGKPAELRVRPAHHRRWWVSVLKRVFVPDEPARPSDGSLARKGETP